MTGSGDRRGPINHEVPQALTLGITAWATKGAKSPGSFSFTYLLQFQSPGNALTALELPSPAWNLQGAACLQIGPIFSPPTTPECRELPGEIWTSSSKFPKLWGRQSAAFEPPPPNDNCKTGAP